MEILAKQRLLSALPNKPNKPRDNTWIEKVEKKREGKSRNPANDLKEGIFEESPSAIARELKMKSDDFKQAMSRLNYYINRAGDNLDTAAKSRLNRAKEALYQAYGRDVPEQD